MHTYNWEEKNGRNCEFEYAMPCLDPISLSITPRPLRADRTLKSYSLKTQIKPKDECTLKHTEFSVLFLLEGEKSNAMK